MKKNFVFLIVFLLILLFFTFYFGLYEARFYIGRASLSRQSFSIDNSYVFITPLRAKANGIEKIRINVFILNNQGLGVMGKNVFLGVDQKINLEVIQGVTDDYGRAVFDVSSTTPGEYYLEVKVDGKILPQKAHLSFY